MVVMNFFNIFEFLLSCSQYPLYSVSSHQETGYLFIYKQNNRLKIIPESGFVRNNMRMTISAMMDTRVSIHGLTAWQMTHSVRHGPLLLLNSRKSLLVILT